MSVIRLIHWNAAEVEARAAQLRAAGYRVACDRLDGAGLRALRDDPPAAVIIDLTRLPSHGREMAVFLRKAKATRHVPLVFVEGETAKVARIRELLPDAVYTTWSQMPQALAHALAHPPADPVTPASVFAAYSGTPLRRKLGIKPKSVVMLINAPGNFAATLGELPEGVVLRDHARAGGDLIIWFTTSRRELERRIHRMGELAGPGGLWVVWPKQASGMATDLTQVIVRRIGLASGLVDYKVCALDATWTGLRFTRRKAPRR